MKLLICDDEKNCLESEEKYIIENEPDFTAECFMNSTEILRRLNKSTDDVVAVLMDIELDNENGIIVAEQIYTLYPEIKIIFLTAYSLKYCEEIFLAGKKLMPFALVDKTNLSKNLKRALDKLKDSLKKDDEKNRVVITSKSETLIVNAKQTFYLTSDAHFLTIAGVSGKKSINRKLSEVLSLFPNYFVQCHKSYAVNIYHIVSYNFKQVELDNGDIIPVSRKYSQSMRNHILKIKCGIS